MAEIYSFAPTLSSKTTKMASSGAKRIAELYRDHKRRLDLAARPKYGRMDHREAQSKQLEAEADERRYLNNTIYIYII